MTGGYVELALAGIVVFQQVFFMRQIQKLVDKAMSRDFAEYKKATDKPEKVTVQLQSELPEDLRTLQGITG